MRANNLGVAYLNQQKLDQALKEFQEVVAADKDNASGQLNLGIALLNLGRVPQAEAALQRAAQLDAKNPAVPYNLGLLHRNNGQAEQAIADFSKATELAPDDTYAHYFLGDVYSQQQKYPEAEKEFRRAVELDPVNVSAEFGLAGALRRQGKTGEAKPHFERFQKLTAEKLGSPVSQIYGEQGPLSLARVIPGEPAVPPAIPARFIPLGPESGLPTNVDSAQQKATGSEVPGPGICVFDLDGDGLPDVLIPNSGGHVALYLNRGKGAFQNATKGSGLEGLRDAIGCAAGDYDNDGKTDIAISTGDQVLLFHNEGAGKFGDRTKATHIEVSGHPLGIAFLDYDHDGDLDLYVTRSQGGNQLLRNNGDNTFTDVTAQTRLEASGPGVMQASDINNDRAVDLVLTSLNAAPSVHINPREGAFKAEQPWTKDMPCSSVGVVAVDFNKDGWMDLAFTHAIAPGLTLWRNV